MPSYISFSPRLMIYAAERAIRDSSLDGRREVLGGTEVGCECVLTGASVGTTRQGNSFDAVVK